MPCACRGVPIRVTLGIFVRQWSQEHRVSDTEYGSAGADSECERRLAEGAALDRSYLAAIETGRRNPSVRSLLKIGNALGVRIRELFE